MVIHYGEEAMSDAFVDCCTDFHGQFPADHSLALEVDFNVCYHLRFLSRKRFIGTFLAQKNQELYTK
jgi:hypothetical protein